MTTIARHHHYVPQTYLRGFTPNGQDQKSKLTVIDLEQRKSFSTVPRNVAGERDFNRVDHEDLDPTVIETEMGKFEGLINPAIREIERTLKFEGDAKDTILTLMSLLAIRSPQKREHLRGFYADISEKIMQLTLATEDRYNSQLKQMKQAGVKVNDDVTYQQVKEFFDEKRYEIEVPRELHIAQEFSIQDTILQTLGRRQWLLLVAGDNDCFITSDNPVGLRWLDPDKLPPMMRNSPGYGCGDTQVYFPLSKKIAVVGEYLDSEIPATSKSFKADRSLVGEFNTRMMMFAHKQIYFPFLNFSYVSKDGKVASGHQFLKDFIG